MIVLREYYKSLCFYNQGSKIKSKIKSFFIFEEMFDSLIESGPRVREQGSGNRGQGSGNSG